MIISGKNGAKYQVVIGLEVHAQIASEKKLFSQSKNDTSAPANTNISPLDIALPGALPVLNPEVLPLVIRAGIGINAKINTQSQWDRKNYFYPDLPSGYQITQF